MRHKYLLEGIAKKSETQAFRRYTEFKKNQGETDINNIKEDFIDFRNKLRTDISFLRSNNKENSIDGGKYEEGCTRLFLNDDLKTPENIRFLNNIIGVIIKNIKLYNQYDKNLNDLSLEELKNEFQDTLQQISDKEREDIEQMGYTNQSQNYRIVRIDSFNEAKDFYKLCIHKKFSNNANPSEWCLTYGERHFNDYSSEGTNQIYFCIKNGISEDDDPVKGDGHPQDEYGNSMISVIVDENGKLAYSTSRWNHELDSDDQCYSVVDISRIVGVDFYKTFLPNHNFKDALENAMKIYQETGSLEGFNDYETFQPGIFKVKLLGKLNFLNFKTDKLVNDIWFDGIDYFDDEGFASIMLNEQWNFINSNGEIISKTWFDNVFCFSEGFAPIYIDNKGYNFINTNGDVICDKWFSMAHNFCQGFASVRIKDKWNFINRNGKTISDIWFDMVINFKNNGFAKVGLSNKGWFKIDVYGNLYDENNKLIHNGLISQQNSEQIANESVRRNGNLFINEVLNLNKRIKKLYE